jgi:hypothetical protein
VRVGKNKFCETEFIFSHTHSDEWERTEQELIEQKDCIQIYGSQIVLIFVFNYCIICVEYYIGYLDKSINRLVIGTNV